MPLKLANWSLIEVVFPSPHPFSYLKKKKMGVWKTQALFLRLMKELTFTPQDTAGSERYEAMSRIYYRGAKAAIVCYGKGLDSGLF